MRILSLLVVGSCLVAGLCGRAFAQLVLEPIADGTLFEDEFGDLANGAGERAFVGDNAGGEVRRAVMRFDTSGITPGTQVVYAKLEFYVVQMSPGGAGSRTMNLHRVTGDWSEGNSNSGSPGGQGTDPEMGDATWIHRSFPSAFWSNPGGDIQAGFSASLPINSTGTHAFSTSAMLADVQTWIDNPTQSFGWMLKMEDEGSNSAVRIGTRESANVLFRPRLTLEFNTFTFFCSPADPNSTGLPTELIGGLGFGVGSGLHLEARQGPPGQFGYFLVGTGFSEPGIALGSGHLCLATTSPNAIGRYNIAGGPLNSIGVFDAMGRLQNAAGTSTSGTGFDVPSLVPIPSNPTIAAGDRWSFQLWHRENSGGSNFSNGLSVRF